LVANLVIWEEKDKIVFAKFDDGTGMLEP